MTRKRSQHSAGQHSAGQHSAGQHPAGAGEPRIERGLLRNHDDPARIERVWERLDGELNAAGPPHVARLTAWGRGRPGTHRRGRRWPLVAAAAAAGFAVGVGVTDQWSDRDHGQAPVVRAAEDEETREVFAAGRSQQSYALPGGGVLELQPGSIVDTVRQGRDGLTLRLVRGEATLSTASFGATAGRTRLALLIGQAEITTAAGSMRVRLDGATADLRVLDGSADVTAPDPDEGTKHSILGPNQRATVPVRVVTARVTSPKPGPLAPSLVDEPGEEPEEVVIDEPPQTAAWIAACQQDDYALAVELLNREPSGAATVLANVNSARLLSCIASGHRENKNSEEAKKILHRIVTDHSTNHRATVAAAELERIYRREGNKEKEQELADLRRLLDEAKVLPESEDELCKLIQAKATAGDSEAVVTLGEKYRSEYPDGECRENVERLISLAEAYRAQALPPDDGTDPYADASEEPPGNGDSTPTEDGSDGDGK